MFTPSWNAPSDVAPSPKSVSATASDPFSFSPQASPAACGHLRRDRDADRRDVHVLRVPPAGRVPAPPLEDRGGRQAAQQPDRRVAVAREDPVAVLERVDGTGLDRLVAAEDRVRPDPTLSVVDDRPLVVRPEADERAVDREKRVVVEPIGPAVGLVSEPDHALEALLDGGNLVHTLSETAFLFCCQAREGAILRDSRAMAETVRFSVEPIRATRTFEAAIEHLTEAIERAGLRRGRPAPERGSARRRARDLEADPAPGAPRARALRPRRGAAREGGRRVRHDGSRPRRRDLLRGEARGGRCRRRPARATRARARGRPRGDAHRHRRRHLGAPAHDRPARASPRRAPERDARRRDVPPRPRPGVPQRDDPGSDARRRARPRSDPRRLLGRRRVRPPDARRPPSPAPRDGAT